MSLAYSGVEPQPSLAWQFESSNVDSVTGLAPSSQVSPGPAQLVGSAALVTNAPTSNTAVYFPGVSGSYMNLGTSSPTNFNHSTSNIFVEAWVNIVSLSTNPMIYERYTAANFTDFNFSLNSFGVLSLIMKDGTTGLNYTASNAFTASTGTWYHVAFSYEIVNKNATVFVNGFPGTAVTLPNAPKYTSTTPIMIGGMDSQNNHNLYIRDLRVVQGGIVPTTSFTPSAAPFSYALPSYVTGSGSVVFTLLGQFVTYMPGKYNTGIAAYNNPSIYNSPCYIIYNLSPVITETTGFTLSCWVNMSQLPASGSRMSFANLFTGSGQGCWLAYDRYGSGTFSIWYENPGVSFTSSTYNLIASVGTWYHICGKIGGGNATIYVNGVAGTPQSYTATGISYNKLYVLCHTSGTGVPEGLIGVLDDLRIYNTALTAAQVQSVYSSQGAPAPSRAMPLPQLAWSFDGTTTDYVKGVSGSVRGVINYETGKIGTSLNIKNPSGTTSNSINFNFGSSFSIDSGFSECVWFKCNDLSYLTSIQIVSIAYSGYNNPFRFQINTGGSLQFQFQDSVGNKNINMFSPTIGAWYHLTAVAFNGVIIIYVNGAYYAQTAYVQSGITLDNISLGLATNFAGYPLTNGSYDDFRIFNTALTSAQVQSIYNQQGVPGRGAGITQYIKSATGGTVQDIGGYRIHTFTAVGTSTFTPATSGLVEVLVVAGGGAGGRGLGGGGGAGGLIYQKNYSISGATTVTIGDGGNYAINGDAANGSNSVFGSLTAIGGGVGGNPGNIGNGGSGGGQRGQTAGQLPGTGTTGQGNSGGSATGTVGGAGGGGAGSIGADANVNGNGGNGGNGLPISISGTSVYYAGGGGGGSTGTSGTGGLGGGGSGGTNAAFPVAGTVNTGGGGGGGSNAGGINAYNPANGGSGIVIVRYPISGPVNMTGTPLFTQLSTSATSSAVGAFSLRAVNGSTAKAVAVQAHPVVQWPPVAMTSNTTVVSGQLYGNGTYVSLSSNGYVNMSTSTSQAEFRAFDYNTVSYWEENYPLGGSYVANTGALVFPTQYETTVSGATAQGNWLQIQLPTAVTLRNYQIVPRVLYEFRSPSTFWIAGSNDGTTWSNVHFQSGITGYTNPVGISFTVPTTSNSVPYSYYRLIVNKTVPLGYNAGNTILNIVSWNLFGDAATYAPNAAQDFYADRLGNLLTAPVTGRTLANWLGTATGYVTTWYDQSGAGNHATQATAANQPIIQRATKGPGYSCYFLGSQWVSYGTTSTFAATPFSVAVALRRSNGTNRSMYAGWGDTSTQVSWTANFLTPADTINFNNRGQSTNSTIPVWTATEGMYYLTHTLSNNYYANNYVNGAYSAQSNWTQFLTSSTTNNAQIGRASGQGTPNTFYGEIYEVLVFTKSLYDIDGTSTITQIYNNQVGIYGT